MDANTTVGECEKVFVVENDGLIAYGLSLDLKNAGFGVAGIAASGEDALTLILTSPPQLVLIDIHLSGRMDGIELAEHIREKLDIPFIYLTALCDTDTLKRAKVTTPAAYLSKPVTNGALAASIKVALRRASVESELRRLRRTLSNVLDTSGGPLIAVNHCGRVELLNKDAEGLSGLTPTRGVGLPIASLLRIVDRTDACRLERLMNDVMRDGGVASFSVDCQPASQHDSLYSVCGEIVARTEGRGKIGAVFTLGTIKRAQPELPSGCSDNRASVSAVPIAGVAQDVRSSLPVSLHQHASFHNSGLGTNALAAHQRVLIDAAETALDVTHKLAQFSSARPSDTSLADWNSVLRDHEEVCRCLLGPNWQWSTILDPQVGLVRADPTELSELLLTLVRCIRGLVSDRRRVVYIRTANVEFRPRVSPTSLKGEWICLAVRASDCKVTCGPAPQSLTATSPMTGSNETRVLLFSGVDAIVHDLGGTVDLEHHLPSGVTYSVYLPRARPRSQIITATALSPCRVSGKNIFVVDDDPAVLRVLVSILLAEGHRVTQAEDGTQALELARQQNQVVDLLITDVMMPGMSGPTLSFRMKATNPALRTLFVTGYQGEVEKVRTLSSDCACVLLKPFSRGKLLASVQAILTSDIHQEAITAHNGLDGYA